MALVEQGIFMFGSFLIGLLVMLNVFHKCERWAWFVIFVTGVWRILNLQESYSVVGHLSSVVTRVLMEKRQSPVRELERQRPCHDRRQLADGGDEHRLSERSLCIVGLCRVGAHGTSFLAQGRIKRASGIG